MVDVPLGGESYQVVYDNGAGTSSAVAVKPSCAAGAFESPAGCVAKLSYAPVVYGLADLAYPVRVLFLMGRAAVATQFRRRVAGATDVIPPV